MSKSDLRLGDLCTVKSSKRVFAKEYVDAGVPFFRSKDVIDKALGIFQKYDLFISANRYIELREKTGSPQKGDLLINSVGNRTGHSYVVEDEGDFYFKDGNILWLSNFAELDPYFLSYWLKSSIGQNVLASVMIGSAQKALTIDAVRNLRIPNLQIENQVSIASVLGALDDKIENNRQMNDTLEEMARAIFKSWFVDFEPVHAKVAGNAPAHMDAVTAELFPSSFGDDGLPVGWKKNCISDFAFRVLDKFKKGQSWDNEKLIDLGRMPSNSIALNEYGEGKELSTSINIFQRGDFLFGSIRPHFCKAGLAPFNGVTNSSVFILRCYEKKDNAFLYALCSSQNIFAKSVQFSKGTKMPAISWGDFSKFEFVDPTGGIKEKFSSISLPMFEKIINNVAEKQTLAELRDTLLSKLMSGEIRVKDAEQEVDAAV